MFQSQAAAPRREQTGRKWAALVLGSLLAAGACTACGSAAKGSSPSSANASNRSITKATINVMEWEEGSPTLWQTIAKKFEQKYPGVRVNLQPVPYGSYYEKLGAIVSRRTGPDVIMVEGGKLVSQYKAVIHPLSKALVGSEWSREVQPGPFCAQLNCNKAIYAVPFSAQGQVWYANTALLSSAGVAQLPKTWSQLLQDCKTLKAAGKTCIEVGAKDYGGQIEFAELSNYTASPSLSAGLLTGATKVTAPQFRAVLSLWRQLGRDGYFEPGAAGVGLSTSADTFAGGKAAFFLGLLGDGDNWGSFGPSLGSKVAVMAPPLISASNLPYGLKPGPLNGRINAGASTAAMIPTWTKHFGDALAFAKYLASPAVQAMLFPYQVYPATVVQYKKHLTTNKAENALLRTLIPLASKGTIDPNFYLGEKALTVLTAQMQLLLTSNEPVHTAAAAISAAQ